MTRETKEGKSQNHKIFTLGSEDSNSSIVQYKATNLQ